MYHFLSSFISACIFIGALELHLPALTGKIINVIECTDDMDVLCHGVVLLLTLFKFPVTKRSQIECYHSHLKKLLPLKRKILANENFKVRTYSRLPSELLVVFQICTHDI